MSHTYPPAPYISFSQIWPGRGVGRYVKRRLSKARRRAWKDPHQRGVVGVEREANWKTW